jgi:hypothetical protein
VRAACNHRRTGGRLRPLAQPELVTQLRRDGAQSPQQVGSRTARHLKATASPQVRRMSISRARARQPVALWRLRRCSLLLRHGVAGASASFLPTATKRANSAAPAEGACPVLATNGAVMLEEITPFLRALFARRRGHGLGRTGVFALPSLHQSPWRWSGRLPANRGGYPHLSSGNSPKDMVRATTVAGVSSTWRSGRWVRLPYSHL